MRRILNVSGEFGLERSGCKKIAAGLQYELADIFLQPLSNPEIGNVNFKRTL